jgi:peptidoglycan/LPS O-acetylase OafA/YrhL
VAWVRRADRGIAHFTALWHLHYVKLPGLYFLVDLFFVLSGFVITHSFERQVRDVASLRRFALRRLARIWPLHVFVLLLFVALELAKLGLRAGATPAFSETHSLPSLLANFALLNAVGLFDTTTWNYPSWSIGAEIVAYMVFGVFCVAVARWRTAAALAIVAATGTFLFLFSPLHLDTTYDFGAVRCLYGFFIGHLTYHLFEAIGRRRLPAASLMELAAVAAMTFCIMAIGTGPASLLVPPMFAGLVLVFAHGEGWVSALLKTRPFQVLGERSYSIYLLHVFIVLVIDQIVTRAERLLGTPLTVMAPSFDGKEIARLLSVQSPWLMDAVLALYLVVVVVASGVTFRYVEMTGQEGFKAIGGFLDRRRRGRVGSTVARSAAQ